MKILVKKMALLVGTAGILVSFQNCTPQHIVTDLASTASVDTNIYSSPEISLNSIPDISASSSYSANFNLNHHPSVILKSVTCQLDTQAPIDCMNRSFSFLGVADGDHVLKVAVETAAGVKVEAQKAFRKDSTPPEVTVSQKPAAVTASLSTTISFSSKDNLTGVAKTECSLNNATYSNCSSPMQFNVPAAGNYNFRVRATDLAGNFIDSDLITWTVDMTVPSVMLSQTPAAVSNLNSATFVFSGLNSVSLECQLDGAAYAACTSPKNFTGLSSSSHTFNVRSRSATGTLSSAVSYVWTIDTSAPSLPTFVNSTGSISKSKSASISFTSTDTGTGVKSYQCSLDNGAYSSCSSPYTSNNVAEGAHSLKVKATDGAGNVSAEGSVAWTVDSVVPTLSLTPLSALNNSVQLSFTAADAAPSSGLTVQCSLDGGTFSNCSSPVGYSNLSIGNHSIAVRAQDAAGNNSLQTYTWLNADTAAGAQLYATHCSECHGEISVSTVRNKTASQINTALATVDKMIARELKAKLTANQVISIESALKSAIDPSSIVGRPLYDAVCLNCHGTFESSTLRGVKVTATRINDATVNIGAMNILKGNLTANQLSSLESLFAGVSPGIDPVADSNFQCPTAESEKQASTVLKRLSGPELQNTYKSIITAASWTAMDPYLYLLPADSLNGDVNNFYSSFTLDNAEKLSRFNDFLASEITSSDTKISAFFGSCATSTSFVKTCYDTFMSTKAPLILRRALDSTDNANMWTIISSAASTTDQLKVAVQLLLNDPRFQYHLETGTANSGADGLIPLSSYEIANRIAYGMTGAPADTLLWNDAVAGKLTDIAVVASHVDRISTTAGFSQRVVDFTKFYIGVEEPGSAPDVAAFLNGLNVSNIKSEVTSEFTDFVSNVIITKKGTLQDLFTSTEVFPRSSSIASILNSTVWSSGAAKVATNHPGILTRPYLFLVNNPNTKLVQRGKKIRTNMLCYNVPQPSASDIAERPALTSNDLLTLTRRQYIDKATLAAPNCIACHSKMNQLGFLSENYDSLGRFSTTEKIYNDLNVQVATQTVNATSVPNLVELDTRSFSDIKEFQKVLSQSDTLQRCMARKTFHFFHRHQENLNLDSCRLNKLDNLLKKGQPLISFFTETFKQKSMLYKRGN